MQFGDAQLDGLASFLDNLLDSILKAVRVALFAGKGAELATQDTIIGVVDVAIEDIAGPVTVLSVADQIGNGTKRVQVLALEKPQGFFFGNAFAGSDLIVKVPQRAALDKPLHALAIAEDLPIDKAVPQNNLLSLTKEERRSVEAGRIQSLRRGSESVLTEIKLKKGESVEKALRRLKKKIDREGTLKTVRNHRHFEKPSEKRRRKEKAARFSAMLSARYADM